MKKTAMKSKIYCLGYLIYFLLFFLFSISACSNKSKPNLRFVFIGDLHYKIPDFQTADYLVPMVARELDSLKIKPEFLIQTGDFFHGAKGTDIESESAFAFKNFKENLKIPFFIAKGNHDTRSYYEKNALPVFSRESGSEILRSYYSFNKANCHFIMLDCTDENPDNQISWLENDLMVTKKSSRIEHIFVAGHYPLWIVARAGFTRPEFSNAVASLLAKYRVDAYFCGHTHNKTATVRLINGYPLTQLMDAGVVEEGRLFNLAPFLNHTRTHPENDYRPGILPLDEAHQIFIPPSELKYYWGYQEGSTTSYYIITVEEKSVRADWHVLGQGVVSSFRWDRPGELIDSKSPVPGEKISLTDSDLVKIEKAWFYAAPWTEEDSIDAPFSINGVPCGILGMSRKEMASSPFWNKIEVPLPLSAIHAIKRENEICISNPSKGKFGLAHMFLLVQFKDGRFARSNISQKVLISFNNSEVQYTNFPDTELIESVDQGNTLPKIVLKFDQFYEN
jgi:hypothetical protein